VAEIIYTDSYVQRVKRFIKKYPEVISQYGKTLKLLELNPNHPSLRLHKLNGKLAELYSVSINISYRISIDFLIEDNKIIPVDIGSHDNRNVNCDAVSTYGTAKE
jgi:proteic killer suppression protein